jgi:hypothetical protein
MDAPSIGAPCFKASHAVMRKILIPLEVAGLAQMMLNYLLSAHPIKDDSGVQRTETER